MNVIATPLAGVFVIAPRIFGDARGWFVETYHRERYAAAGIAIDGDLVQDNLSRSRRGVLRGLHFQLANPQGKLVQVLQGAVFDVAVDLRRDSPTFARWHATKLSADDHRQIWIPRGFAHGFLALTETALVSYKCSAHYDPRDGRAIRWDDPDLAIAWPLEGAPVVSAADAAAPLLRDAILPGDPT
jgi:dTDP-4-dehydrorhamnose 3,5-epimerase